MHNRRIRAIANDCPSLSMDLSAAQQSIDRAAWLEDAYAVVAPTDSAAQLRSAIDGARCTIDRSVCPARGFLLVFCSNHSPKNPQYLLWKERRTNGRITASLDAPTVGGELNNFVKSGSAVAKRTGDALCPCEHFVTLGPIVWGACFRGPAVCHQLHVCTTVCR